LKLAPAFGCLADLHLNRQYLPTLTHTFERPSMRFLSTSRIESFDHRLIAIIRQTTSCVGESSRRCRFPSRRTGLPHNASILEMSNSLR
jgi:hypothetical protein